jgi:hypothetical protein
MAILKGNEYQLPGDFLDDTSAPAKSLKIIKSSSLEPIKNRVTIGESRSDQFDLPDESQPSSFSDDDFLDDSFSDSTPTFNDQTPDSDVEPPAPQIDFQQEVQPYLDDLVNAINGLKSARDQVLESAQQGLVDLSLEIAGKVINKVVELDPSVIKGVVEDTFNKISGSDRITFKINPADMEAFNSFQTYVESRLIGVDKITVQQDQTIEQGGCMIETDLGFVDVTIKEKLNIIAQAFKKVQATL